MRRSVRTGELAFYRCFAPTPVPLATLVRVAGRRWTIEESFQAGKGLTGLDEHQVRRWTLWHRWTILAMLAHAFLAITAVIARAENPSLQGLIALTANEVRHLFTRLVHRPLQTARHAVEWSQRRRRHQARARECHYRRQTAQLA
jgi:SRSO17 transposase